jgi:uncharacterized membrane protein
LPFNKDPQRGLLLIFVFGIFLLFILTIYWSIFNRNLNAFLVGLFGTTVNVWIIWFVTDLLRKKKED